MADTVTSALVNEVVGRLTSKAIQEYGLLKDIKNDLLALSKTLKKIQRVLNDAEEKQKTQKDVEEWLRDLKSASLEAENVLDKAKTKAMIERLHREMGKKYKRRAFFSSRYNPLMVRSRIAHEVKNIRNKLKVIDANSRSEFQLISDTASKDDAGNGNEISKWETCSRMPPLVEIYGRDKEKEMIVDKICNHDDDGVPRVYAIWGMGGVGKTTLAKLVYHDETVKFDLKCWVYVSAVFDVKRIIEKICGLEDKKLDRMSLEYWLGQLQNKLEGKKYFIIMDDVWIENKDMNEWEKLRTALRCGEKGSTVMVTTRNEDTAKLMAKNNPGLQHNVGVLSDKESWSLFQMLAFRGVGDLEENVNKLEREGKESEGKEIVKKCNGLPLAVKSLGSLMSTKERVDQWQLVNKNFKSNIQDNVFPALRLSYDDLPPQMKICFAYCCLFSKGEEMSKDLMIELWMANEFIPSQDVGEEIFDSLVVRSFFQDVVEKDIHRGVICKMHDLMHDLALELMTDDCAVIESGESRIPDEVLHLSLLCYHFEFLEQDLEKLRSVRSMLVFHRFYESNITQISSHVYLRVLYLKEIKSSTLPESICKLIHLRYLKISNSEIEVLPESIIYLQNLQVLILEWCLLLRELPKGLRYMGNLQRLDTLGCPQLHHMPVGIEELTRLRRLSNFVVGENDGARIGELRSLNLLGRELTLSKLENVGGDAKSANLKDKTNLKSLELEWTWFRSETNDSKVLEGLEPNSGLQELTICNYMGTVLSPWLVKLVNLTSIKFHYLEKCEQLPPLGKLPSLKRIELLGMISLKCFHDDDNATPNDEILFRSLQDLDIGFCGSLVSLPNNFSKLQLLNISECEKLCSLPDEIQSFKDLNEITIYHCKILSRRCKKASGEDWPKISHIHHLNLHDLDKESDENEDMDEDNETLQG